MHIAIMIAVTVAPTALVPAWADSVPVIKIDREPIHSGRISPYQYGQFMEYLCDLFPSMWAEHLYDGSFEGLSSYRFAYLKETDFKEKPWYPSGATNRARYEDDPRQPISGKVARKISVAGSTPCTVGISQDGIFVDRDRPCQFTCYLRQQGLVHPVEVAIHMEGKVLDSCAFKPGENWEKFRARLVPNARCTHATLRIHFRGPGTLWLDNASLMPEDTVGGWRRDVVEAVRSLKPGIIRFGGSAVDEPGFGDFEWRDTIGPVDQRKPFRAWGGLQPVGPGLEEFVQFCRHVAAEPLICVRVRDRRPSDAAEEVEYFNGSAELPMGRLRTRHGHPKPYGVRFWQIGNEISGKDYQARLPEFCRAMRAADPTIKLLSSYPSAEVLRGAGRWLDYVCPHHYDCTNIAAAAKDFARIRNLIEAQAPGRPIKIAVTEWNTTAGDWGPRRARLWTLENALACARYHNLLHRHCDIVTIANRSNLCNSFCSGCIQTDNHRLYKTPAYYAQQLYATLAGHLPLRIAPATDTELDISATDGHNAVTLFVVNPGLQDVTRVLDLSAHGRSGQEVSVWTLADRANAGEPDAANGFAAPERVATTPSTVRTDSARFPYCFKALSLTVLRWKK
jgi:alpha-N-arabinofuranosidase